MRVYEITLSREAQTLSMSEPRGGPEFKSVHSVWDRLANAAAVDGRIAQTPAIRRRRGERAKSTPIAEVPILLQKGALRWRLTAELKASAAVSRPFRSTCLGGGIEAVSIQQRAFIRELPMGSDEARSGCGPLIAAGRKICRLNPNNVAIVGASIAGCAAATFFGRAGARVVLIERDCDPAGYKKLCTHYIQASAVPTLERLGLVSAIEEAGGVRNETEVFTRWGWIVAPASQTIRRPAYGYNIRRSKLDPMLRKVSAQTRGVDFAPGYSVRELLIDRGRFCGVAAHGEGNEQRNFGAKLIIGADGRESRVAELAGLPAKETPNGRIFYFAHYRNLPLAKSQIWFLDPDVAYAFPNDDGVTLIGAMPARAKATEWKADPEAAMTRLYERLPRAPSLAQGQRMIPYTGFVEYPNLRRPMFKSGLALIGDAALSVDPLWGVGCGWTLQSAEWLAEAVGRAWSNPAELDRGLAAYAKRHRSELAGHRFLIEDFATGRPLNLIELLTFSAAARDPVCADNFVAFGTRCIGVSQFLRPGAVARAMWVNARHVLAAKRTQPDALH
jgi:flavin-dependent dehydrogenase